MHSITSKGTFLCNQVVVSFLYSYFFFCWWLHHIKGGKSSDMIYLGVIYFPMQQPLFLFYFSLSLFLSLLFVQPHEKRSENSRGILWTIHHNINTRNTCMVLSYIHSTFILQSLKLPPAMIISVVFVHTCLYMLKLQIPFSFFNIGHKAGSKSLVKSEFKMYLQ